MTKQPGFYCLLLSFHLNQKLLKVARLHIFLIRNLWKAKAQFQTKWVWSDVPVIFVVCFHSICWGRKTENSAMNEFNFLLLFKSLLIVKIVPFQHNKMCIATKFYRFKKGDQITFYRHLFGGCFSNQTHF